MAYKCSFLDNQEYTAQDVNDIFARLSFGGVVFTDTGHTLTDLNNVQAAAVSEGVTRDENSCKVVLADGVYKISKGACFMNDGSAIIFDDDGSEIEVAPEAVNYVYLMRNSVENSIDIVVSAYEGNSESIPLAMIDEEGHIYDRRAYAKAKVDLCTGGTMRDFTVHFKECGSTKSETLTIDMGDGVFSYIVMWDGEMVYGELIRERVATDRNLVVLSEGEDVLLPIGRYKAQRDENIYCKKDGQLLHLYLKNPVPTAEYTLNLSVI